MTRAAGAVPRIPALRTDLVDVFLLSLVAMFNPSLLAAVTLILLLPNPKKLMLGYLLGAYLTSIGVGLLIVFSLHGTTTESTSKQIGPAEDIVVGLLSLALAWVIHAQLDRPLAERRRSKKEAKLEARREAGKPTAGMAQRLLRKGDPRLAFAVGVVLSFPGVSYLDALDHMHKLDAGTAVTILLVVYFCIVELLLIELPLLGYAFAPDRTQGAVDGFKEWIARSGRGIATIGAVVIGVWLLVRGVVTLL